MSGAEVLSVELSVEERETLAGLADVLIPPGPVLPSASDAGVSRRWVDRVLAARPDLDAALRAVLAGAAGADPEAEVARLRAQEPVAFATLALVVEGAYYLNRKVRKLIKIPFPARRDALPDEADFYLEGGLLDPVINRGPIYTVPPRDGTDEGVNPRRSL
jgi:hypothetical protein